ncbi:MAG: amino acid ABC transporter substrate-binding protein [Chloroflexota bacterium]|nr:amino acid ABC transporter substrate-binding protein [Chloroflexota bacterium]
MATPKRLLTLMALLLVGLAVAACGGDSEEARGDTLGVILDRGNLICGIKADTPGFGVLNPDGTADGNDVEYCRALAAAVFGDKDKVEFKEATSGNRFELLAAEEIDVLIRTTTWTASRDANLNVAFAPTTFYDGAGVMVKAGANVSSVRDLDGATICILDGTSTQGAVSDFFAENGLTYSELTFQANPELRASFISDQCDGWSSDKSQLGGHQFTLKADDGIDAVVLPETLSKEPLGPSVRDYDSEWEDVVRWVVNGMIIAEEQGVTMGNVGQMAANPPNNTVARLLGVGFQGGAPANLGIGHGRIPSTFMQDVIAQVGNYGEAYERTLERVGLTRAGSPNASYLDGGLIYAPPMR